MDVYANDNLVEDKETNMYIDTLLVCLLDDNDTFILFKKIFKYSKQTLTRCVDNFPFQEIFFPILTENSVVLLVFVVL